MSENLKDGDLKQSPEETEYEMEEDPEKAQPEDASRKRRDEVKLRLDTGKERIRFRRRWYQLW